MKFDVSLGVISADPLIRKDLSEFAEFFDLNVVLTIEPDQWQDCEPEKSEYVDYWMVDDDVFDCNNSALEAFLDSLESPVMYGVERVSAEPLDRQREFSALLRKLATELDGGFREDFDVWVLGASLGGPEAVKAFLDSLPEGLPVCFLYAQHLDEVGSRALGDVLCRDSSLSLEAIEGVTLLQRGKVYTIPVESSIEFVGNACYKTGKPWLGDYSPSIDELLRKVSHNFGRRASIVYFSGMGGDGAITAKELADRGARVWAQSPQSSISSAMPESVIEQGICQRIASPSELALLLRAMYQTRSPDSLGDASKEGS